MEAGKSQTSSSVAGVNRRTAVLFGNKTPRRSVPRVSTQTPSLSPSVELRTPRRPGRPPKQAAHAVTDATKTSERATEKQHSLTSEHTEQTDEHVPKKRGRKKRSTVQPSGGEFGSQWGEVVGSITSEWSAVARAETSSSTRSPQKESFRQYRVMHDSDTEGVPKSENDHQMASLSSSSSSSESSDNGNSSSHSDDEGDDVSGSSSSSSPHTSPAGTSGDHFSSVFDNLFITHADSSRVNKAIIRVCVCVCVCVILFVCLST